MLAAGFATPLASAALMGTMVTAIRKVHPPQGPWKMEGGYEYNLVLIAALLALAEKGQATSRSTLRWGTEKTGPTWAQFTLGLGAGSSTAAIEVGRRAAPAPDAASG